MSARAAIKSMGGITTVARKYGYNVGTVGSWSSRQAVPPHVLIDDKKFAKALRRAGYVRRASDRGEER